MAMVRNEFACSFKPSERLKEVIKYNQDLAISGKRNLYTADQTQLIYHWTDSANGVMPQSGEWSNLKVSYSIGDHAMRVDIGKGFPQYDEVPSHVYGYEETPESYGRDYAFLLDHTPPEIHPFEYIVGEFHWEMNEIRKYYFGDEIHKLGHEVRKLGAGGTSHGHTCPDFSIGLSQGWGGILKRIEKSLALYTRLEHESKAQYLRGLKLVCESIIRFVQSYSSRAAELAIAETEDEERRKRYLNISSDCANIAENPPETFRQAVQWIYFAMMTDRIVGHGNGYGRLDMYLNSFYQKDLAEGRITREEAREYLAEMFLKSRGQHFSIGGRMQDGSDASNDMSYIILEAYDMVDDYNNLFLLWHKDIDPGLFRYACDVVARHGASVPSFSNYDLLVDCELRSGVSYADARTVSVSGCQWFCIPGKEYCDQDVNSINLLDPMWRAMSRVVQERISDFECFYRVFEEEFHRTSEALRKFKDAQYEVLDRVWPEMATSLNCHGPIERGIDITGRRGVDYQFTSTNILGLANVCDSLYAMKKLVFKKKIYTMEEVLEATGKNWENKEIMRQQFLNVDKYGNDIDDVDNLYVRICDSIAADLDNTYNNRGQQYRASLFQFQGHTCVDALPATPDGRLAHEPLAHGVNPTAGRNTNGLLATANSVSKVHNYKFQGGSLQVEMQPKFFDGKEDMPSYIMDLVKVFFEKGGFQINFNIIDLNVLRDAIDHPEKPEYQNIIIKVTGYTTRFICLDRLFQEEFCSRNNYSAI